MRTKARGPRRRIVDNRVDFIRSPATGRTHERRIEVLECGHERKVRHDDVLPQTEQRHCRRCIEIEEGVTP